MNKAEQEIEENHALFHCAKCGYKVDGPSQLKHFNGWDLCDVCYRKELKEHNERKALMPE